MVGSTGCVKQPEGAEEPLLYLGCPVLVIKQAVACAVVVITRTRSTAYFSQRDRNRVDLNKIPALSSL